MDFTKIDFKKLFSTRNIIILASAVLVLTLTLTLVFCTKKDEDEPQGGDQSGQVTPDSGNPETPENPGDENPANPETPTDPEQPEQPEHTHEFVEGKCECGEDDPDYVPAPSIPELITYAEYLAMSPQEQYEYYKSFSNYDDFFAWIDAAEEEYKENNGDGPTLDEDGNINVDDLFGDK